MVAAGQAVLRTVESVLPRKGSNFIDFIQGVLQGPAYRRNGILPVIEKGNGIVADPPDIMLTRKTDRVIRKRKLVLLCRPASR